MLYIGCDQEIALKKGKHLTVEILPEKESKVTQWFDTKHVYFIGSHSGCSCGFPHVIAEEPIEYYEGMFDENEPSEADLNSILKQLTTIVHQ